MKSKLQILVIEDDSADQALISEALSEYRSMADLHFAKEATEAWQIMRTPADAPKKNVPDLVLLDLNLPGDDGYAILTGIRTDPALRRIPVIVLTSSESPRDIDAAYASGANCYVTKALGFEEFLRSIRLMADFWLTAVKLPASGIGASHDSP